MLFVAKEWQGSSGYWYCSHTDSFPKDVDMWVVPARILGISADAFIKLLIEKFQPDEVFHNEDCSFVSWRWKSQAKMRLYKNWINAEARKKNFQV